MLASALQMTTLSAILPYAEIILSLLLIIGIVLQQRGAGLGGAFGGDNFASTFYKRRGAEKFLFTASRDSYCWVYYLTVAYPLFNS
jgi:protein translocase SecG subunit